jgi:hypothetical protein
MGASTREPSTVAAGISTGWSPSSSRNARQDTYRALVRIIGSMPAAPIKAM